MVSRDDNDAHRAEEPDVEERFDRWLREAVAESLEAQRKKAPSANGKQGAHSAPRT
jgi:hypothetical protein